MPKRKLREEYLERRRSLSEEEWIVRSQKIQLSAIKSIPWKNVKKIGLYAHRGREVATSLLFEHGRREGVIIGFPRVVSDEHIHYYEVDSWESLSPGRYGILEPVGSIVEIPVDKIDLFVVPGLVFDRSGVRIGYGRGYFDRLLRDVDQTKVVALAFDVQIANSLPHHPHDVKVGRIITETEIIECCDYHCEQ